MMGIPLIDALIIIDECKKRGITGRVLTLGKQDCDFTVDELLKGMAEWKQLPSDGNTVTLPPHQLTIYQEFTANGRLHYDGRLPGKTHHVSDVFFFRFIGFESITSIDAPSGEGAYEGADIGYDLNELGLGAVAGQYDLIYDGGTIEHVFHVPNMMQNIFDALKIGGHVFHNTPSNNSVDHGFYQFSPTFFQDYYSANGYGELAVIFCRVFNGAYQAKGNAEAVFTNGPKQQMLAYRPGMLNHVSYGGLDDAVYTVRCYAKKVAGTTGDRKPQQGGYPEQWERFAKRI